MREHVYFKREGTIGVQGDSFYLSICPVCSAGVDNEKKHVEWHKTVTKDWPEPPQPEGLEG